MKKASLAILLSGLLFFAPALQAIEIRDFDRLAGDDQIRFIDQLIDSVEAASSGPSLAQVKRFFMNKQPGEQISGMGRFEVALALARIADIDAAAKNPHASRLQVEDVLYITMARNGITLPASFRPTAPNFRPKLPVSPKPLTREDAVKAEDQARQWAARTVYGDTVPHEFRPERLAGFTDTQKAIAFFMGIILLGEAVDQAEKAAKARQGSASVPRTGGGGAGVPARTGGGGNDAAPRTGGNAAPARTTAGAPAQPPKPTAKPGDPFWILKGYGSLEQAMDEACREVNGSNSPDCE